MPRYFFDLHNDLDSIDDEGVEFANVADAHAHAVAEARNMVAVSATEHGKIDLRHHIDVRDESGATIGVIRFEEGVTVVREGAPV